MRKSVDNGVLACYDEGMFRLTRVLLAAVLLISLTFTAAHAASVDRTEPIAQVYDVHGNATVKSPADNSVTLVKKGCLLGSDDSLTLDPDASIAMYFKNGGRKEIRAKDTPASYKVSDLAPRAQAYSQSVPVFGATRGIDIPEAAAPASGFFYPQEAVILDDPPVIEFTVFRGPGKEVALGRATAQIAKGSVVLDSRDFKSLAYGVAYIYQTPKLHVKTEYIVELKLELQKTPGNVAISFPLYIAGTSDFSGPVYRSVESTSIDHEGKKRAITAIKQVVRRGASPQPILVIEIFIP